ncbi:MAG: putative esterase [Friedmanniella sp.]|nr:putative esterase [Friedmanniella sp.]
MQSSAVGGVSRVLAGTLPRLALTVPRTATGLAREVGWAAAHLAMYPLGLRPAERPGTRTRHDLDGLSPQQRGLLHHDVDSAATPILLVHGIIDNHSIFTVMEHALRRRGFATVASYDYGLLTSDIPRTARRLGDAIEKLAADSGYERVHVVGHSLGGLIARYYVQRLGGDAHVHTLVTLGTPHHGTELARAARVLPLIAQLTPRSPVIQELAEPAPDCRTRFVAFHSDLDHLVVPSRNARIDHPDLQVRNVAVRGVGHLSMPHNRRIAFEIAATLRDRDEAVLPS